MNIPLLAAVYVTVAFLYGKIYYQALVVSSLRRANSYYAPELRAKALLHAVFFPLSLIELLFILMLRNAT